MKLSNYIIPTFLLLAIAVTSCELRDDGNRVSSITLEQTSATLAVGENLQLSAVITPADVANPNIIWSSSNTTVATVSDGIVTAISDGTTTVTATTQDGGHIATSAVTVRAAAPPPPTDPDPDVPVTGVTVSPTTTTLYVGDTEQLTATVLPSNATNQNVTWESNDNSIATVDSDGLVTAVAEGTATITVMTIDGGYTATSIITVTVATIPMTGCNDAPLSFTLGVPYFASVTIWSIPSTGGGRPSQEWSDVVRAPGCDKTTFNISGWGAPLIADCRNATNGFHGHYFSWCMVMRFADVLCPGDWRVPTRDDFVNLDMNLGGTGANSQATSARPTAFMPASGTGTAAQGPGGTWGGSRFTAFTSLTSANSYYWSSTESGAMGAFGLRFNATTIHPQANLRKDNGFALRCVR